MRHTLNKIFHELGTHHSAYISNMVCMIKILVGKGDFEIKAKIKLESDLISKKGRNRNHQIVFNMLLMYIVHI